MAQIESLIHNEYFQLLVIILVTFIVATIFRFISCNYIKKIVARTKSALDDEILKNVTEPIYIFIIIIGIYIALKTQVYLAPYSSFIEKLFFIISVLIISLIISRILKVFINNWLKFRKKYKKTPQLIGKVISITIYIIAFLIILAYFNIEITPIIATLGIGALAIGLALQDTLSNFFAGLHIISDRPVDVGDFVELEGDISGYVEDIGWRSTRIRTLRNTCVIIPNAKLAESTITNDSLPEPETAVLVSCGVAYESDLDKVEKITIEVAREIQKTIPGAVADFEPFIRYNEFAESNINFRVILRVSDPVVKYLLTHEFMKALKKRYDEEGIEISWPIMKVYKMK